MKTQLYPTDLSDSQWDYIKDLIPPAKEGGRPRTLDMRLVVNAILLPAPGGPAFRRSEGLRRLAPALGRGAYLCLAQSPSPAQQGLRSPARNERGYNLHRRDSYHGAAFGSRLTFSDSF
jgi:hypothetical protein